MTNSSMVAMEAGGKMHPWPFVAAWAWVSRWLAVGRPGTRGWRGAGCALGCSSSLEPMQTAKVVAGFVWQTCSPA